jgi:hypothetical protein
MVRTMFYDQANYVIRCEWGLRGLEALAPGSDVVIIRICWRLQKRLLTIRFTLDSTMPVLRAQTSIMWSRRPGPHGDRRA